MILFKRHGSIKLLISTLFFVLHLALNSAPSIYLWRCIIAETCLIYFHISYWGLKLFTLIAKFKAKGCSSSRLCLSEGEVNFPAGSSNAVENEEASGNYAANVLSNSWIDLLNNYPRMRRNPSVMAALCGLICILPHLWINIGLAFSPMESADGRKKNVCEVMLQPPGCCRAGQLSLSPWWQFNILQLKLTWQQRRTR